MYPFPKPIGISLGTAHRDLRSAQELAAGIQTLRDDLAAETGVKIPDVYVDVDEAVSPPEMICFDVFEMPVAELACGASDSDRIDRTVSRFGEVLRDNLFRWLSLDDVELWSMGWSSAAGSATSTGFAHRLPSDPASRLRLCHVLRLLLRERISIADRSLILDPFFEAEKWGPVTPGAALRVVRSRLYPAILGPHSPEDIRPVPSSLEASLAAGLRSDMSGAWELPRSDVARLVDQLQNWYRSEPPLPASVISVTNELLRPHVWRLLSADQPRIFVLAQSEIR